MSATQKQISRQKRQWKAAVAEGKEFKPKGAWLFDPEKEPQALKKVLDRYIARCDGKGVICSDYCELE
eukprot:3483346-Pyramimonas_sp.AAC.1